MVMSADIRGRVSTIDGDVCGDVCYDSKSHTPLTRCIDEMSQRLDLWAYVHAGYLIDSVCSYDL